MAACQPESAAEFDISVSTSWRAETHPQQYPGRSAAFGDASVAVHSEETALFRVGAQHAFDGSLERDDAVSRPEDRALSTLRMQCPQAGALRSQSCFDPVVSTGSSQVQL